MSKFTSRFKHLSKLDYFYFLTGLACIIFGVEKVINKEPIWKIAAVTIIGILILIISYKRTSK